MKNFLMIVAASAALLGGSTLAQAQDEGSTGTEPTPTESGTPAETPAATATETTGGADAPKGPLGIGGATSLFGVAGIEVVYHVSNKLMLEGLLGITQFSPDQGDSTTTLGFSAAGFFSLFDKGWADLYIGGRLGYRSGTQTITVGGMDFSVDESAVDIEVPLRIELQLHRRLGVHFETGLGISLQSLDSGGTSQDATQFVIGATDLFATGGFTIYL